MSNPDKSLTTEEILDLDNHLVHCFADLDAEVAIL